MSRSAANTAGLSRVNRGSSTRLRITMSLFSLMNEQQSQQHGNHQPEAGQRPGGGAPAGMAQKQQAAGEPQNHAADGEDIDEPAPGLDTAPAREPVIDIRDPASLGGLG